MDLCLLHLPLGPSTTVEPGTLRLQLGPLIFVTMRAEAAAEVLEVLESLEVLV